MNRTRKEKIDEIIDYLEKKNKQDGLNNEAIKENINFFVHTFSIFSFFRWLYKVAPGIGNKNLLELMDMDENSPYDHELIDSLAKTERRIFPGLINPLVKRITNLILQEENPIILNLGSGAMEVERQVILELIRLKNKKQVVFIGIDRSLHAHEIAKENLNVIKTDTKIIETDILDEKKLKMLVNEKRNSYTVILCKNDIFSLERYFKRRFDLVLNCFFRHHFALEAYARLENSLMNLSKRMIEYDGFNNHFNTFIQSVFVWKNPVLLSGTVFSNLRYQSKKALKLYAFESKIKTYWLKGTYLKETINTTKIKIDDYEFST